MPSLLGQSESPLDGIKPASQVSAGILRRSGAALGDIIALGLVCGLLRTGVMMIWAIDEYSSNMIAGCINLCVFASYETLLVSGNGATPGKHLFGLEIVGNDGLSISIGRAFFRFAVKAAIASVILIPLVFGIGGLIISIAVFALALLMIALTFENRGIQDRLCGTRVVRSI